jgi:hypothetical protein
MEFTFRLNLEDSLVTTGFYSPASIFFVKLEYFKIWQSFYRVQKFMSKKLVKL